MFNGIIKSTGKIYTIRRSRKNCSIQIKTKMRFNNREVGSSISCSGTCLTLSKFSKNFVTFFLSNETLNRTIFKFAKKGNIINLEKSIRYGDRISGHFVQGHVDTTAVTKKIVHMGKSWLITFIISKRYKKNLIEKGSITINGVSLTLSKILKNGFEIAIIPKTLELTNLIYLKEKDLVNVEFDVLGKYIKSFIK